MSDPISASLKPRPDERPSDERFPTPWSMSGSAVLKILDAEGDKVASAQRYYPYIKESAMPFIVHRVNAFDSLLEACRRVRDSLRKEQDYRGGGIGLQNALSELCDAISSAEKQP